MQLINDTIILTKEMKDILGDVVEYAYIKSLPGRVSKILKEFTQRCWDKRQE